MGDDGNPTALRATLEGALGTAEDADARYYIRKALQLYDAEQLDAVEPLAPAEADGV